MNQSNFANFLDPDECLVYVQNREPFADTNGTTHIGKLLRTYMDNDRVWFDVLLITDADGNEFTQHQKVTVSGDNIVSYRSYHDIEPKEFYHYATVTNSEKIEYPISGRGFVIKKNIENPLENTSRSGLGSGIYGKYNYVNDSQTVYLIKCNNPYIVQDIEHSESITLASLNTNRYLDRMIQILRFRKDLTMDDIIYELQNNPSPNILSLWNIVLYRTEDIITQDQLDNIFAYYIMKYLYTNDLVDSINGDVIEELPINYIMKDLGYDGLLASDGNSNKWNRGCISYDYSSASLLQGQTARY